MKQIVEASVCEPSGMAPDLIEPGARTWLTRGATFVIAISEVEAGAELARADNADEYMLFTSTGMRGRVEASGERVVLDGRCDALTIVPPGASRVVLDRPGVVTRIFTQRAADLRASAGNAAKYAGEPEDESPAPPPPPGGFALRHYALDDHIKPDSPARPFRSTNMLVNAFVPRDFRRDTRKMTPHAHAEFDQASLALQGRFVHHLRYPWIPDMTQWREDQ
ncbi:MAG: hypothetical protein KDJ29_19190, partial [Hyphomicrobiales bacterium]|nr:hypothetical protein [Hyphomicrobiales bacterium]